MLLLVQIDAKMARTMGIEIVRERETVKRGRKIQTALVWGA